MEILQTLNQVPAPTGYEFNRARTFANLVNSRFPDWNLKIDKFGSVITTKEGKKNTDKHRTLMVAAHLDEISATVRIIEKNGRIKISKRGSYESRWLIGKAVKILSKTGEWINGIVCGRGSHSIPQKERKKPVPEIEQLEVFIGASSETDVLATGIHVGAPIVFSGEISQLNPSHFPEIISGPGMDDLSAIVAMLDVMEQLREVEFGDVTIHFVASAREEMGGQGAIAIASCMNPDHIIALDIAIVETAKEAVKNNVALGKGPVIVWQDHSGRNIYYYETCRQFAEVAEESGIPHQDAVFEYYGSDAAHVQISQGIPGNLLTIPTLFSHNVPEVTSLREIQDCARLLVAWVKKFWV